MAKTRGKYVTAGTEKKLRNLVPFKPGQIPGWSLVNPVRGAISIEPEGPPVATKPAGKQALKFVNQGPVASMHSDPFPATHTGRISVFVWLRVDDPKSQPPLRLAIEGTRADQLVYYRPAEVGQNSDNPIDRQWSPFQLRLDDLPTTGLDKLQVRFDMMGPGSVWIDDVQLCDLWFKDEERIQLIKTEYSAQRLLQQGNYAACLHLLDGYWPRFLADNVPLSQPLAANSQRAPGTGVTPPPAGNQPNQTTNPGGQTKPERSAAKPGNLLEQFRDSLKR